MQLRPRTWPYVRVTKLNRRYPKALQLTDKVRNEDAASDHAAGKGGLNILHLDGTFLLGS